MNKNFLSYLKVFAFLAFFSAFVYGYLTSPAPTFAACGTCEYSCPQAGNPDACCNCAPGTNCCSQAEPTPGQCNPNCSGRVCGADGCGGSCGSCGPNQTCSDGNCTGGTGGGTTPTPAVCGPPFQQCGSNCCPVWNDCRGGKCFDPNTHGGCRVKNVQGGEAWVCAQLEGSGPDECTQDSQCQPQVTSSPIPTSVPTPTPTPRPPAACNRTCGVTRACPSGLVCQGTVLEKARNRGRCRLAACPSNPNCLNTCITPTVTSTPTFTPTPTTPPATPTPTTLLPTPTLNPAPVCSGLTASPTTVNAAQFSKIKVTALDSGNEEVFAQNFSGTCGSFPSVQRIEVWALGDPGLGVWPQMELWVNGARVNQWAVDSETVWQTKTHSLVSPQSIDDLAVTFINDGGWPADDRNLHIDKITLALVGGSAVILEAENLDETILDRAVGGSSYFDGNDLRLDDRSLSGIARGLYWNSSLRFPRVWQAPSPVTPPGASCNVSSQVRDRINQIANCGPVTINVNANQGRISGTAWEDRNRNARCNDDEASGNGLGSVNVTVNGANDTITNATGLYATSLLDTATSYNISAPSQTIGSTRYFPADLGNYPNPIGIIPPATNVDFCLSPNPAAWFQTENADLHSNNSVSVNIPQDQYFMNGPSFSEGVLTTASGAGGISLSGLGKLSRRDPNNWRDASYTPISTYPSYDTFWEKYQNKVGRFSRWIDLNGQAGLVRIASNVTITAGNVNELSLNPSVVFIGGDGGVNRSLRIRTDVANTNVIFIVSGDVVIEQNVEDLKAAIFWDGSLTTESPGASTQELLTWRGTFVSTAVNGGSTFNLRRKRSDNNQPAEKFKFDPSLLLDFVNLLGESKTIWLETK